MTDLTALVADMQKQLVATGEILALVLNETGPVTIDKNNRTPIPEDAEVLVDINNEDNTVTISLGTKVPND